MKKELLILLLLFGCCYVKAQVSTDTIGLKVYFRQGEAILDASFRNNGVRMKAFSGQMRALQQDTLSHVRNIRIVAGASPEGDTALNKRLAEKRATQIGLFLKEHIRQDGSLLHVSLRNVDWQGLSELVETSDMLYRTEVLDILYNTPEWITRNGIIVDGRKRQLGMLRGGKVWCYLEEHFFPELRSAGIQIICERECMHAPKPAVEPEQGEEAVSIAESQSEPAIIPQSEPCATVPSLGQKTFRMALKTNLLYDAALVPNIGAEFYLKRGWSIGGTWMYAWWKSDRVHNYWRTYGGELDIRKYFGSAAMRKPLTGHHLGLYMQGLTYDFELGGTGYLSHFSYGAGIEYGYSLPIARRLNIDFGIGVGYLGGEYKVYKPIDNCYVWQSTRQRRWFGPTKAEITLVWLLGHGNRNPMTKGGKR